MLKSKTKCLHFLAPLLPHSDLSSCRCQVSRWARLFLHLCVLIRSCLQQHLFFYFTLKLTTTSSSSILDPLPCTVFHICSKVSRWDKSDASFFLRFWLKKEIRKKRCFLMFQTLFLKNQKSAVRSSYQVNLIDEKKTFLQRTSIYSVLFCFWSSFSFCFFVCASFQFAVKLQFILTFLFTMCSFLTSSFFQFKTWLN